MHSRRWNCRWKNVSLGGERCGEGDSEGDGTWISSFSFLFCDCLLFSWHERHSLPLALYARAFLQCLKVRHHDS